MKNRFGFLLFAGLEELDLVGPWEMVSLWSKEYDGPKEIITVSQAGGSIICSKGLKIISDYSFLSCPDLDYLLIPGGIGTRKEVDNQELISYIQKQSKVCKNLLSVCTGSFLLQAAGLLNGRKSTTHWKSLDRLRAFPEVEVIEERYVKDGNIWTSAGISAGIDMTLAFIAETANKETAGKVQLQAEYFPENINYVDFTKSSNLPAYLKKSIPARS